MRYFLACILLALEPARPSDPPPALATAGLHQLLRGFAELPGVEVDYAEDKQITLLAEPLTSTGTIYFLPPDRLARHQRGPEAARMLIDRNSFRIEQAGRVQQVDLDSHPEAQVLVGGFLDVLGGNLQALQQRYVLEFEGTVEHGWTLALEPRDASAARIVSRIVLTGKGLEMASMQIEEPSGDRTVTRFSRVRLQRKFTPAERRSIFRLGS